MIVHLMKSRGRKNVNRLYKMAKRICRSLSRGRVLAWETFGGVLRERAEKYGDQIAVVSGNTYITYSELDKK